MVRAVSVLMLASLALVPFWVTARPARACSCVELNLPNEVRQAELIVLGSVREIPETESYPYDLTVSVSEYLKGSGPSSLTIRDSLGGSTACSIFEPPPAGGSYLLILHRGVDGFLGTSTCSGSLPIGDQSAPPRIEQIRQLVPRPTEEPPTAVQSDKSAPLILPWPTLAGALTALALGILAIILWRSVRSR